jgi:hypothetical protein
MFEFGICHAFHPYVHLSQVKSPGTELCQIYRGIQHHVCMRSSSFSISKSLPMWWDVCLFPPEESTSYINLLTTKTCSSVSDISDPNLHAQTNGTLRNYPKL